MSFIDVLLTFYWAILTAGFPHVRCPDAERVADSRLRTHL